MKSLIFDLDGTLIDSCEDIASALNHTLEHFHVSPKSIEEVQRLVGDGVRKLIRDASGKEDEPFLTDAMKLFKEQYSKHYADKTTLYPDVREILHHFKEKKLAVVSNKPYEMVLKTLNHFGIQNYFEIVLGPESTRERKPHPEPILKAIQQMKVPVQETLLIGDGTTDIQAGKSAGTWTCAVTYGYRSREELEKLKPEFIISHIDQLREIVQ